MKSHLLLVGGSSTTVQAFSLATMHQDSLFKCTIATDIEHAMHIIPFVYPDAVFIHLVEPVMKALDFAADLRKMHKKDGFRIVVFADQIEFYQNVAKGYGADLCLTTPNQAENISGVLEALVSTGN